MNGSHQVHIVDLNTRRITRTIPTNTSGFNGPRESVLIGNTLYVTTYASDVRMFDITTGAELGRLNPRGKPEGIAVLGNSIVVANAFEANGFNSGKTVVVLNTVTSVKNSPLKASISLSPNPTTDRTTLRVQGVNGFSSDISVVLVNALGKQVARLSPNFTSTSSIESEFSAEELGLAQGMYFVHIRSAQGMTAVPVQIIR
jgi:outer membrane protein assembly factor BamB